MKSKPWNCHSISTKQFPEECIHSEYFQLQLKPLYAELKSLHLTLNEDNRYALPQLFHSSFGYETIPILIVLIMNTN